jgi:cold shock CspA family protein
MSISRTCKEESMSAWKAGKVRYFDENSGRGLIICDDGEHFEVHYSSIISKKKWKTLKEDKKVKFQKYDDDDYRIVKAVREV